MFNERKLCVSLLDSSMDGYSKRRISFWGNTFSKSSAIYGENKRLSRRAVNINESISCKYLIDKSLCVIGWLKKMYNLHLVLTI